MFEIQVFNKIVAKTAPYQHNMFDDYTWAHIERTILTLNPKTLNHVVSYGI